MNNNTPELAPEPAKFRRGARRRYLTKAEAAEMLRCHQTTIDRWEKAGRIQGFKLGRRKLYREDQLAVAVEG
jgi:excisionase family DNA binding protein